VMASSGCAWLPKPPDPNPTPTPEPTPTPDPCTPLEVPWCHETEPPMHCGECQHQPPEEECPIMAPPCAPPEPQCPTFTDRGGTLRLLRHLPAEASARGEEPCDCYMGQVWMPCPVEPPPAEGCTFPQGVPESDFTGGATTHVLGTQVNAAMERLTGCMTGTTCKLDMGADEWFAKVTAELRSTGLCAGRHNETPPGATDEIAVATSCTGWWEGYHVYNYGGRSVVWSPGAARPSWKIDPRHCDEEPEPPPGNHGCPEPLPPRDVPPSKTNAHHYQGKVDTTAVSHGCDFCASIGFCCMPGTGVNNECGSPGCVPRCDCPPRPEGHPDRYACETYFYDGDQLFKDDRGEVLPPCTAQRTDRCVTDNRAQVRCSDCESITTCRADGTHCSTRPL
jgi:hypothetical protein